jgi:hypothetical protein
MKCSPYRESDVCRRWFSVNYTRRSFWSGEESEVIATGRRTKK